MNHELTSAELWLAVLGGVFVIVASLGGVQYTFHRQNRAERDKDRAVEQKKNQLLDYVLAEHLPHSHTEDEGEALNERGIRYPKGFKSH